MLVEIIILGGVIVLILTVWWFHIRRHSSLDEQLACADQNLLTRVDVKVETAIQAPKGSIILPYTVVSQETVAPVIED